MSHDITKIGIYTTLALVVLFAVVFFMRKKDHYQYPLNQLYSPNGANTPGNGGQNIPQSGAMTLVSDTSGNISTIASVPMGLIAMWAGSNVPYGWGLCNGSSYTNTTTGVTIQSPDLRSRFVVGAGQPSQATFLNQYGIGDTGGEEYHQLTIPEMPAHTHTFSPAGGNGAGYDGGDNWLWGAGNTSSTGGDPNNNNATLPHNNMPPYYALAFIIKYL